MVKNVITHTHTQKRSFLVISALCNPYRCMHKLTIAVDGKWSPCSDDFIVADLAVLG